MSLGPGSEVRYTVKRGGESVTLVATLAEPPEQVIAQWVEEYLHEKNAKAQMADK